MPWEVRITTELVHDNTDDDIVGRVYLADGTVLHVISHDGHTGRETILAPDRLPREVAELVETVHERLEAQRDEIFANMNAGIWGGIFKPDGTPDIPPYDRSRLRAVVVTPLRVGRTPIINIGGYGDTRAAQYAFTAPITKLIGND